jgi:DNA polymerase III subunit epsilon
MRQIVLDTETTGLSAEEGHRIIEIGCIEIVNRRVSEQPERRFHRYLNPERDIDVGASEVHGLTLEKLQACPRFADIALEFIEFVRGAEIIIHNAPFDVGFLNQELQQLGGAWGRLEDYCTVFDTLKKARELHPGQRNSLDALCKRYEVENAHRTLHGALLDAELLADVYLAMTGGQAALGLDNRRVNEALRHNAIPTPGRHRRGRVLAASAEEITEHQLRLEQIDARSGGNCVWLKVERSGT